MRADLAVIVSDQFGEQERSIIVDGLLTHMEQAIGRQDNTPLAVLVKDSDGNTLGGALGRSSLAVLFLDLFHIPETLRHRGLGTRVLAEFEAEGKRRGCRAAVLYTISFQAPEFYEKCGWSRFGDIPCDPPGSSRIFMRKQL
jgi:GNAT superfamily N-acetyltransferase